ncbi:clathrin interactor EPSIN 3-like isoform X3 [Cucurbita moschata]|uniref:Clathrin interactor EPSIN 3-like isoform X3 n=1 Tax=Cucurbita moschata TaxID=3662 RepID=A0A6J1H5U8_CUCMO|nr:clathrin interactor EPSIN 3-like isoform X3 [Cucurbita moschata]
MKKVFGQTVRDIKREVNKTVLKVPRLEQKVLDATSNEPWGPHGTLLAEIAQASKNYHECQMIMAVIWKRVNDSGKNWRHVYKGLTVLEYLVAHGSERVIDEIKDHAYQLSGLSSFQYIDSSGRDQGSNVRKKSQSLVLLVNDSERISEIRQKANTNRDKFRSASLAGGAYRPNSNAGGYGDRYDDDYNEGRYRSRDEDRNSNGYGREREYDYRADDRGRNSDSNIRDRDQYRRDGEERYGKDSPRDGDSWGRRSVDDHRYGSRRDQDNDHDDNARDGSGRGDDRSPDVRRHDHKFSEQDTGAPPSYEEAVNESQSPPAHNDRDQETSKSAPATSSSPVTSATSQSSPVPGTPTSGNQLIGSFDAFDPRSSVTGTSPLFSAAPTVPPNNTEMDLLGSLTDFPSNPLAIMPVASANVTGAFEPDSHMNSGAGTSHAIMSVASVSNQSFEDPFGDTPFKAMLSDDGAPQFHSSAMTDSLQSSLHQSLGQPQPSSMTDPLQSSLHQNLGQSHPSTMTDPFQSSLHQGLGQSQGATPETNQVSTSEFSNGFSASTGASGLSSLQAPSDPQFLPGPSTIPEPEIDILADILPPSGPPSNTASLPTYSFPSDQPALPTPFSDPAQPHQTFTALSNQPSKPNDCSVLNLQPQPGTTAPLYSNMAFPPQSAPTGQLGYGAPQGGSTAPAGQLGYGPPQGGSAAPTGQFGYGMAPQGGSTAPTGQHGYGVPQGGSTAPSGQHGYGAPQGGSTAPSGQHGYGAPQGGSMAPTGQHGYGAPQGGSMAPTGQHGYGGPQGGSMTPTGQHGYGGPQGGSTAPTGQHGYGGPQGGSTAPTGQHGYGGPQGGSTSPFYPQMASTSSSNPQANGGGGYFIENIGSAASVTTQIAQQNPSGPAAPLGSGNMQHHGVTSQPLASHGAYQVQNGHAAQPRSDDFLGSILPQAAPPQVPLQQGFPTLTDSLSIASQPSKGKFETKSTVWTDTLNRGLVDLNISGPKTNPLADIGVDFDSINRKEKRMEKPTTTAVTSTITMGKAMGSGSGMGRAGAGALRAPSNPMVSSGMGMNNVGMGGPYGGINQPMGMGMGMGMGMNNAGMNPGMGMSMNPGMGMNQGMNPGMGMGMNPGMGMNMGMGQGMQFRPPGGFQLGSNASGSYNPMMSGYAPQQSYGGGYQ